VRIAPRALTALPVLIAVLLAAPAGAAASHRPGTYEGRTKPGNHVITIGFDRGHIRHADSIVFAFCVGEGGGYEFHRIRPVKLIPLHANGKIDAKGVGLYDGGQATFTGRVSGSHASGRIVVSYTTGRGNPLDGTYHVLDCRGTMTWRASWKHRGYPRGIPSVRPPAKRSATYRGTNDVGTAVSFTTSSTGLAVAHIRGRFPYRCSESGKTGTVTFDSHTAGAKVNPLLRAFAYTAKTRVGTSTTATVTYRGSFTASGTSAAGDMEVSFFAGAGDNCFGNHGWKAKS
jgi:hypothetical protein